MTAKGDLMIGKFFKEFSGHYVPHAMPKGSAFT